MLIDWLPCPCLTGHVLGRDKDTVSSLPSFDLHNYLNYIRIILYCIIKINCYVLIVPLSTCFKKIIFASQLEKPIHALWNDPFSMQL